MDILKNAIARQEVFAGDNRENHLKDQIHIAFGVDANFVRPMGVTITSLLMNNQNENIIFHIFVNSIHEIDISRLEELVKIYKTTIHLYHIDKRAFDQLPTTWQYSHATYNRFLLAKVLYGIADRVLYLDADIVCVGNIRELMDIKMGDSVIAVVQEENTPFIQNQIEKLKLRNGKYFNAGVLCIDINKWQENDVSNQAMKLLVENYGVFNLLDQDALNVILDGKVKFVSSKWDFMCNLEKKIKEIPSDTVLIHYTSREKPWHRWCIHPLATTFTHYAKESLWRDVPLDSQPRSYKEMKMLGRALFHEKDFLGSLYWYFKYAQEKAKLRFEKKK
ncbi:glycosyltransferase family 8 protein [Pelosinus sp. sgz500959]|uniref:glycosyltransferase family 8 protein n=1 Tax=Pelosinus sp. sgz500959 TaxID=3242472 RepID=UPI00366AC438